MEAEADVQHADVADEDPIDEADQLAEPVGGALGPAPCESTPAHPGVLSRLPPDAAMQPDQAALQHCSPMCISPLPPGLALCFADAEGWAGSSQPQTACAAAGLEWPKRVLT